MCVGTLCLAAATDQWCITKLSRMPLTCKLEEIFVRIAVLNWQQNTSFVCCVCWNFFQYNLPESDRPLLQEGKRKHKGNGLYFPCLFIGMIYLRHSESIYRNVQVVWYPLATCQLVRENQMLPKTFTPGAKYIL